MTAVAIWAWVGAVVVGVVVLGFCAYEVRWKVRRVGTDMENLQQLRGRLVALQDSVAQAQATNAAIARQRAANAHRHDDSLFPHPKDPAGAAPVPVAAGQLPG